MFASRLAAAGSHPKYPFVRRATVTAFSQFNTGDTPARSIAVPPHGPGDLLVAFATTYDSVRDSPRCAGWTRANDYMHYKWASDNEPANNTWYIKGPYWFICLAIANVSEWRLVTTSSDTDYDGGIHVLMVENISPSAGYIRVSSPLEFLVWRSDDVSNSDYRNTGYIHVTPKGYFTQGVSLSDVTPQPIFRDGIRHLVLR